MKVKINTFYFYFLIFFLVPYSITAQTLPKNTNDVAKLGGSVGEKIILKLEKVAEG